MTSPHEPVTLPAEHFEEIARVNREHYRDTMGAWVTGGQLPVRGFQGEYRFLSNFWLAPVILPGYGMWAWPTSEHAYQAQKEHSQEHWRRIILASTPGIAKKVGRGAVLRPDWEQRKKRIMFDIVRAKFEQHPDLAELLIATGERELIEENTWGDTYWGVCRGQGRNYLGQILMFVRELLRED